MDENSYINRELSWLEFNRRVLEEARDESVPLLERVKFLAIFSSNLDEFFMVRVARLKRMIADGDQSTDPDGLTPTQTLTAISKLVHELAAEQHLCFLNTIMSQLSTEGIHLVQPEEMSGEQERFLEEFFQRTLYPIVTPLAIDPGHPFPYLANRSLCLVVSLRPTIVSRLPHTDLSIVHIPTQVAPRFIPLPTREGQHAFMLLEDVLGHYLPRLYQGFEIRFCHAIRVTRDADFLISRRREENLLVTIEKGVRERRMGDSVRLQYDPDLPHEIVNQLVDELELTAEDLYPGKGFTAFTDLFQLYAAVNVPRLKDRPQIPLPVPAFDRVPDMWSAIRNGDVLVFHPYQSFEAVTRFVEEAALDPKVLAIKMTLYRVSPTSPIAQALARAAEAGKEVSVLVELQARFDEEANITWARALEEVGAHVVYGMVGFKTHCKVCLVVRQEADGIPGDGKLQCQDCGHLQRRGVVYLPRVFRRRFDRAFQFADRLHPAAEISTFVLGADGPTRAFYLLHPPRSGPWASRANGSNHRQSEQPDRSRDDRGVISCQPSRGADRFDRARHV